MTFHEITRSAIERALKEKGEIDQHLVDAQQARRVLDRIVGYQVSPLLWSRIEKGSSAGRVQSVALRLVVERERAIEAFRPEEYWVFSLVFRTAEGELFSARLFKIGVKGYRVGSAEEAGRLLDAVLQSPTARNLQQWHFSVVRAASLHDQHASAGGQRFVPLFGQQHHALRPAALRGG